MRLEEVLVAVLPEKDGTPVGGGLLVAPDLVLTCAHVVNAALGLELDCAGRPSGAVNVKLHAHPSPMSLAEVDVAEDAWSDPPAHREPGADLCLLRLKSPFAMAATPLLMDSVDLLRRPFRAAGFPEHWDLDIANGVIESFDSMGLFLLRPAGAAAATLAVGLKAGMMKKEERPAGLIHSGFSGAPVEVDQRIAGLVCEARGRVSHVTSYMIPVSMFPKRLQPLVDDIFRIYQQALGEGFERAEVRLERWVVKQGESVEAEPAGRNTAALEAQFPRLADQFHSLERVLEELGPKNLQLALDETPEADKQQILECLRMESRKNLQQALAETPKIVLLGDPGIGKSTALRELERADLPWIPIRLDLRFYQGAEELEGWLAKRVNEVLRRKKKSLTPKAADAAAFLQERLLKDGQREFVFLLDGLDEVSPEHHIAIRSAIRSLLAYPARCVISCRGSDYDSFFGDDVAAYFLEDLTPGDIRSYLERSLGEERGGRLFESQIDGDAVLLSMAANPLLLSLMAKVAEHHPEAQIPSKRAELFQKFVEDLPPIREREGGALPVARDVVNTALEAIGFEMLDRSKNAASLADIRTWNVPTAHYTLDAVLAAAYDCRILLSSGSKNEPLEFIHPLFRDYFAARFLKNRLEAFRAAGRERDSELTQLGYKIWQPQWDQCVLMLATIHARPAEFIVWVAGITRLRAHIGQLCHPLQHDSSLILWFAIRSASRSKQLMKCWKNSRAEADAAVKEAVLGALRAVVRYSKSYLQSGNDLANSEVFDAIEGLETIGDQRAIPDLEGLIAVLRGPYKTPLANWERRGDFLTHRATAAIARMRGQMAVWVIESGRSEVIGRALPDPLHPKKSE